MPSPGWKDCTRAAAQSSTRRPSLSFSRFHCGYTVRLRLQLLARLGLETTSMGFFNRKPSPSGEASGRSISYKAMRSGTSTSAYQPSFTFPYNVLQVVHIHQLLPIFPGDNTTATVVCRKSEDAEAREVCHIQGAILRAESCGSQIDPVAVLQRSETWALSTWMPLGWLIRRRPSLPKPLPLPPGSIAPYKGD